MSIESNIEITVESENVLYTLYQFEEISINVPWGHISGRWYGNQKVRPILALHGWLDNLGTWSTLAPLLPQHIGILCIDLPGHGRSSKYPPGIIYRVVDYVPIITRIMKEYNWQKVSLLGHSMGSVVSFIYAALFPQTVDLLIGIDLVVQNVPTVKEQIHILRRNYEKNILENERQLKMPFEEPPSYTFEELEQIMYEGSRKSVEIEKCKFILKHNIEKSKKFPNKFYFSRDNKIKYYMQFFPNPNLFVVMARKLKNVPYIIIKGSRSSHIDLLHIKDVIDVLQKNCNHFEFHEIEGTHHLHLNNPKSIATIINPFINRYRHATLDSWSIDDEKSINLKKHYKNQNSKSKL